MAARIPRSLSSLGLLDVWRRKGKLNIEREFFNYHSAPRQEIKCGRLAGIFDDNFDPWGVLNSEIMDLRRANQYISPQLSPSGTHQYKYSSNESEKLKQRDNASDDRNFIAKSPSIAPVIWSFLLVSGGFLLYILGGQFFDNGRRYLVGVALFCIGSLLGAAGILPWGFLP